jgi:hypothetical protein
LAGAGQPAASRSSASVTTAPSTQPPVIEPSMFPRSSITIMAPTGSGAEPSTSTSSAWTTRRSSDNQAIAVSWVAATTAESITQKA